MVRFFKDSFVDMNPRGIYWELQSRVLKRNRLWVSMPRIPPIRRDAFQIFMVAVTKHWNYLFEGISMYVPRSLRYAELGAYGFLWIGLLIGIIFHHTETKLWREKIWDKEPGAVIPLRRNFFVRAKNYILNYNVKPFIYYFGLFIKERDLDSTIDLAQAQAGRKYRRFLFMEYARRNSLEKFRDKNYDFLEISKMYGKDSL
ncbi:unnamed protein product [Blepharisma stoltei]|uniref:Uncharacterized protein n=1 Tax=Blepharisma stoltei TaxID=1481888 RepID=A0AAU9IVY1_9CILI|nr:unnamed protein product [Blepharisma stoltei]